jgi:hypothetical protein
MSWDKLFNHGIVDGTDTFVAEVRRQASSHHMWFTMVQRSSSTFFYDIIWHILGPNRTHRLCSFLRNRRTRNDNDTFILLCGSRLLLAFLAFSKSIAASLTIDSRSFLAVDWRLVSSCWRFNAFLACVGSSILAFHDNENVCASIQHQSVVGCWREHFRWREGETVVIYIYMNIDSCIFHNTSHYVWRPDNMCRFLNHPFSSI